MTTKAVYDETAKKMDKAGPLPPINQLATLSVPEPRTITIQPWDLSQMSSIDKAILSSGLGLTPQNDGKVMRIQVPHLTEERRRELTKIAHKYAEECRVAVRNSRRDANDAVKKLEKEKTISQDKLKKAQEHIQQITDKEIKKADEILSRKEKEIMEV